ncbi:hypothetical protein D1224_10200 [Henriciella barbarensis]|uniref:Cytochrome c domain-containing protein n=2 Tax=Henriciella barbarensis TaxID=86342 RepID=A0A399R2W4_9PROT|nr:hypothetical protein D1224_10200 [Henriciella barbarensis]
MALLVAGCSAGDTTSGTSAQTAETTPVDDQRLRGQSLALTCSGCHGGGGAAVPDYRHLDRDLLEARLLAYREDANGKTVMHRLMRGYDEADISAVAAYLTTPGDG